ncbi:MAG: 5'-nucleotidase [Bryobacteraceae bacterium]|jgi:5'-nucleotidase
MPVDLSKFFVIGISSRALFDLSKEDRIFRGHGLKAFSAYQLEHEDDLLPKGTWFALTEAILRLNSVVPGKRKVEVVIMSRNSADTSLRIFNSIDHYGLDITRAVLAGGAPLAPYLSAFDVDLFLSADEADVQAAANAGIAAGLIHQAPQNGDGPVDQLRIAFDGDSVLFSGESERIYQEQGLAAFMAYEKANARKPLPEGPFAKVLRALAILQAFGETAGQNLIRTALVTARNSPSHERVIRTLREWNVRIDEAFFLGGVSKDKILQAFGAQIFFDDQEVHCQSAAKLVPTARVLTEAVEPKPVQAAASPDKSRPHQAVG